MVSDSETYFQQEAQQWVDDAYRHDNGLIPIGQQRINQVVTILKKDYPNTRLNICDLGCGGGDLCRQLAAMGHSITGVDRSDSMLTISKSIASSGKIKFVSSAIESADAHLEAQSFDVVTCMGVMYYLNDEDRFFQVAKNLLKPGGKLIVTCRNRLFNLFPGSTKLLGEVTADDYSDLVAEAAALNKGISAHQINPVLALMQRYSAAENIENLPKVSDKQQENTLQLTDKIVEGRQHTPKQLRINAVRNGFSLCHFYGIQPHFMLAGNEDDRVNQVLKKMSEALIPLADHPASLLWCSHFMAELRSD